MPTVQRQSISIVFVRYSLQPSDEQMVHILVDINGWNLSSIKMKTKKKPLRDKAIKEKMYINEKLLHALPYLLSPSIAMIQYTILRSKKKKTKRNHKQQQFHKH